MLGQVYVRACVCDMYMSVQVFSTCGVWRPEHSMGAFLIASEKSLMESATCLFTLQLARSQKLLVSASKSWGYRQWPPFLCSLIRSFGNTNSASCLQSKYSYPLSYSPVPIGSPLKVKSTLYSKSNDYFVKEHYLLKDFMLVYEGYLMSFCYLQ